MGFSLSADTRVGRLARRAANVHRPGDAPSVVILSTPRSGSTWLMEMVRTQPGFKSVEEPINLRTPAVAAELGIDDWSELHEDGFDETLRAYLQGFLDGRIRFMDHRPFSEHHRWRTDRIVFKILHGGEDQLDVMHQLGLRVVHLVRHPLAVARSRKVLPRLDALLGDSYLAQFPVPVREAAIRCRREADDVGLAVLSWCLQNAPLVGATGVELVTYEQLTLDPRTVVDRLATVLELPEPSAMLGRVRTPSHSHASADVERRRILEGEVSDHSGLVDSWMSDERVDEFERAMTIAEVFGIDIYRFDSPFPNPEHIIPTTNRHEAPSV